MNTYNYYKQFYEYLLLIPPPEDFKRSIGKIKKEVGVKYGNTHALHSAANINLIRFLLIKGYERNLLTQIFAFCINRISFEIRLNNFDVFPRHTLYVNVTENERLKKLQSGLIQMLKMSASVNEKNIKTNKKFHMTIARSLNPEQFESVSYEYTKKSYNSSFPAKNVVLLKRPYNEYNSNSCMWSGSHNFVMGC